MAVSEAPAPLDVPEPLAGLPVLQLLSEEHRRLVLVSFERARHDFGQVVVAEGDPADAFYVVLDGQARVVGRGPDGGEVPLDLLRPGDAFGEDGVLTGAPRAATVRAADALELARLDAAVFRGLVALHPELGDLLEQQRRARRLERTLRLHPDLSTLPRAALGTLLGAVEPVLLQDGEHAMTEGEASDALLLVEDGRLRVVRGTAAGEVLLRRVRTGDLVGERGVLLGEPRSATAIAEGEVALLRFPAAVIERLRDEHPAFRQALAERLAAYERQDRRRVRRAREEPELPTGARDDPAGGVEVAQAPAEAAPGTGGTRRFPLVRQLDAMDCGAACVAMVCRHFGRAVSLSYIRHAVGTGFDGTSLRGIQRGGEVVGLDVTPVKASRDRLDELRLPAIVHVGGNHWVVLHEVDGDHVRVADPAVGRQRLSREELLEEWSGYAALVAPTPALELAPAATTSVRWLWPHVRPYRWVLTLALLLSLATSGLQMLMPVMGQKVVDDVLTARDYGLLHLLAGGMLGVVLLVLALSAWQRRMLARAAIAIDASALDFLLDRLLRLPMGYFQTRRSSDIEQRLDGMRDIRALLVENGIGGITDVTQLVAAFTVMALYSPILALCFLATLPMYAGLMVLSRMRLRPTFEAVEEGVTRFRGRQIDALKGIRTVKVAGAEPELRRGMVADFRVLGRKLLKADLAVMGYGIVVEIASFLVTLGFLWGAALLVLEGQLTVGEYLLVNSLVVLATGPIGGLLGLWDDLQQSSVLLGRLQDVFEQEPEQGDDHGTLLVPDRLEGRVTLRGLGFHYPSAPERPVLQDIDLEVAPGTTVALVGRSGCGKSTLVGCIAGLNEITEGSIAFDGVDLRELDHRELRRRLGFVLQDPYIFDDTIAANIAFGEEEPDLEAVRRAAEIADAHEFIARLPLGYDTAIGESGLALSGGQAQRIAIARAVYRQPPIVLLDEATSALDPETERNVKENLDRLLDGRTAFVVAHRLSTVRDADLIVVLEEGRIAEVGTHEALIRRDGLYAHLHASQLAD